MMMMYVKEVKKNIDLLEQEGLTVVTLAMDGIP